MIIHIDCNSFFASCEVTFHPELKGKPVVVANSNKNATMFRDSHNKHSSIFSFMPQDKKMGIVLTGTIPANTIQLDLLFQNNLRIYI